jgi:hypothetical protein
MSTSSTLVEYLQAKVKAPSEWDPIGLQSKGMLQTLLSILGKGGRIMTMTNTLAYNDMAIESFIIQAP